APVAARPIVDSLHARPPEERRRVRNPKFALAATLLALVGVAVLAFGVASGSARTHKKAAAFKAAWIYVGPHADHGWSQAHDKGRLYVQKQLGSKVQTTFKELVPEGPQTCQVIESLVRDGNKIIFGTSFGFQDCMVSEAKKHPDVKFEQATGTAQSKNLAEYFGAGEDAIYLSGMAPAQRPRRALSGTSLRSAFPRAFRPRKPSTPGHRGPNPGRRVRWFWRTRGPA